MGEPQSFSIKQAVVIIMRTQTITRSTFMFWHWMGTYQYGRVVFCLVCLLLLNGCVLGQDKNHVSATQEIGGTQFVANAEPADDSAISHYAQSLLHRKNHNYSQAIVELQITIRYDNASARLWVELAETYLNINQTDMAKRCLERAFTLDRNSADVHMVQGNINMRQGNYDDAINSYEKVLRIDANATMAMALLATLHAQNGSFEKALFYFDKLIGIEPDNTDARYYRAKCLMVTKQYDKAEQAIKSLILQIPTEELYYTLAYLYQQAGKIELAEATYRQITKEFPASWMALHNLCELLLQAKKHTQAEQILKILANIPEAQQKAQTMTMLLYMETKQYEKAVTAIIPIIKANASDDRALYLLGLAYEGVGNNTKRAVDAYKGITVYSKYYSFAKIRQAYALQGTGRTEEAIAEMEKAITNATGLTSDMYVTLSLLYGAKGNKIQEEAIIKRGIDSYPNSVDLLYALGALLEATNRWQDAIVVMHKILKIDANNSNAMNFIGYLYANRGIHLDVAEQLITQALQQQPNSPHFLDSMGWVLFKQKKYTKSIPYLERARDLLPDSLVLEHLAEAYLKAGRVEDTINAYRQILNIQPQNRTIQSKINSLQTRKTPKTRSSAKKIHPHKKRMPKLI
ncbi:MAG: tetratricopeptide repeat protein [Deltaproteobacteria bacterium]